MSVLNIPYINIHDKAPVEQYPSRDKFEHWVFPPANILIHRKGNIWTGTMSPWTVETYVHIKHSCSIQRLNLPGYQFYQPEPSC